MDRTLEGPPMEVSFFLGSDFRNFRRWICNDAHSLWSWVVLLLFAAKMVKNALLFLVKKVILWSFSSKSSKSSREIPIPFRFRVTFQPFSGLGRVWLPWSQEAAAIPCLWDQQRSLGQGALIPPCCKVQEANICFGFFAAKNEVILKKLIIFKVFLQFESHLL